MLSYEEALKRWGAKQSGIEIDYIDTVTLDHTRGGKGCDTCDLGNECHLDLIVTYLNKAGQMNHKFIQFEEEELTEIVREIVEIGQSED